MENHNEKVPEILYPEITSELGAMVLVDQDMREKNLQDRKIWDEEVDKKNTDRLKEIISKIGWPTRSKVGEEGMQNAWLLVQHADHDVDFQKHCLDLMKSENPEEVDTKRIAYLEDRVRLAQGKPQLYGTQFTDIDGKFGPRPIEDEENVDQRRGEIGMEPMEEYRKKMYEKYGFKPSK
jgi:hypothetical protein